MQISVHTAGAKNLSTGIRFKQVILKGFLRLDLQPVQLIFPKSITDKQSTSPSPLLLNYVQYCTAVCVTSRFAYQPRGLAIPPLAVSR
jgi:hypothetical protein